MQNKKIYQMLIYVSFLLTAIDCSSTSSSSSDNTILMGLIVDGGNHFYSLIIGSDSAKVCTEYDNSNTYKDSGLKEDRIHKHILTQGAVDHIWKYVEDHCIPAQAELAHGENFYNIGRTSDTPLYKNGCKVDSKEKGIEYFTGLVVWIEASPYKKECQHLIADIREGFIEGKGFPLTMEQIEELKEERKLKEK